MAKLAFVRYGKDGQGPANDEEKKYTYVVNDNVRKGDRISPVVRHASEKGNNTIFVTTGKVMATASNASTEKGKEMTEELGGREPTNVYSGKELGLAGQRGSGGKFTKEGEEVTEQGYALGQREKAIRGGNIREYVMQHGGQDKLSANAKKAAETFESYSSAFLPTGKDWRG